MDLPESRPLYQSLTPADPVPEPHGEPEFQLSEEERKRAKMMSQLQGLQQFFITISKGIMKILEDLSSHLLKR